MGLKFYSKYLNQDDRSKILNEINQIHSQRFQITLSAITVFGVFIALIFPKDDSATKSISELLFVAPILLLLLLFLLFLYSHSLNKTQITLATYLIEIGESKWEKDSKESRGNKGAGFNYIQSSIFILLGLIALLFPFIIYHFGNFQFTNSDKIKCILDFWGTVYISVGLAYLAIIISFSYFIRMHYQKFATHKWIEFFNKERKDIINVSELF